MITNKELGYVISWANKVPYPGIAYAKMAADNLVNAFDNFNKYYSGKEYDVVLSNGEEFLFEILNMNLCHMLGIDYRNLSGSYFDTFRKQVIPDFNDTGSYDLLKAIINNIDDVLKYDLNIGGKLLNYYRIVIKCAIFDKLSDFGKFNFGVINFDKNTYINNSKRNINSNSEKYLYVQSNEGVAPYFMMGIIPQNGFNIEDSTPEKYAVETLMAPVNADDFFREQEVVIPTQILVTTDKAMSRKEASPEDKIALLNQYRSIISTYGLNNRLNIYGDYEAMLVNDMKIKTKKL